MIIYKSNLIIGAIFFLCFNIFFYLANDYEAKTSRRMTSEFKSKTILLQAYLKELEENHKYKLMEIRKDRERKIEDERDFVNVRSDEILKHMRGESRNQKNLYKIALKDFETYINRFFYT